MQAAKTPLPLFQQHSLAPLPPTNVERNMRNVGALVWQDDGGRILLAAFTACRLAAKERAVSCPSARLPGFCLWCALHARLA